MRKKIAIIGAGFFGTTIALKLSKKYDIQIFEKEKEILKGASGANQFRFHLGYHYPRSIKTLLEVKKLNSSFINFYGKKVFGKTKNYYGIAKKKTKTSFKNYLKFLKKNNLTFRTTKNNFFSDKIEGSIKSPEKNLNIFKIKKIIKKRLDDNKIKINFSKKFNIKNIDNFYKIIVCCYDQNNFFLKNFFKKKKLKKYKYELVEKILIKLPKKYKNISLMVLDGKFVSLDPYLGTSYHLLSDVKYSKIEICKGYYPSFKDKRKVFVNKGIIKRKNLSEFDNFKDNSSKFLPLLQKAIYVGSFFVIRAIEVNKEKTDERLNDVQIYNNKIYSIFSGKWNTCVGMANKIIKLI